MHWKNAVDNLLSPLITHKRIGIITDFDGTLSQIVDTPSDATITPQNRDLLNSLKDQVTLVAVVSGRGAADVQQMVGLMGVTYIGNHGMERWENGSVKIPDDVAAYRPNLESVLAALQPHIEAGMRVEDKGVTASVHYRQTANPATTASRLKPILMEISAEHEIDLHTGKMVFELRPPLKQDKGTAFRALVSEHHLTAAIYLGDDVTDAAALRAAQQMREAGDVYGIGLGVLHPDDTPDAVRTYSDLLAEGVDDVAAFFGWLSNALSASST